PAPPPAPPPIVQASPPPPPPPPPPSSTGVEIAVESNPSGTVFVDGKQVGHSPLSVHLQGEHAHVEIRRPGYATLAQDLVLDRDQRLVVTLTPQKRATPPPRVKPKQQSDGFKRFDEAP